jgi:hypothetical protein
LEGKIHLAINAHSIAVANLVIQALLITTMFTAAYLAKIKKKFGVHCKILRIIIPIQILLILTLMLPSTLRIVGNKFTGTLFKTEILIHHSLGVAVVLLWILINLKFKDIIRIKIKLAYLMRITFFLWILVLILGVYIYISFGY